MSAVEETSDPLEPLKDQSRPLDSVHQNVDRSSLWSHRPETLLTCPGAAVAERETTLGSERTLQRHFSDVSLLSMPPSPRNDIHLLPDLTDRIQSMGLHDEYQRFRRGYANWRLRGHQGARGEATAEELSARQQHSMPSNVERTNTLDQYYPSFSVWKWRRTYSYWIAVLFWEGSGVFSVSSFFGCVSQQLDASERKMRAMTVWPSFFAALLYLTAAYLMCLNCINLMRPDEEWRHNPFHLKEIFSHLSGLGDGTYRTRLPYSASMSYLIGCLIFPIGIIASGFEDLTDLQTLLLSTIEFTVGGGLFMTGGFFETLDTKCWTEGIKELHQLGALGNFLGGGCFFAAGLVLFFPNMDLCSSIFYTVGSLLYLFASVCNVLLWKDKQFGLTFLSAINHVSRNGQLADQPPQSREQELSWRSVTFINLYCTISVLVIFNCCLAVHNCIEQQSLRSLTWVFNEVLFYLMLHMVLVAKSAVALTPKAKPFHMLVIGSRWLCLFIGANSLISFYVYVRPDREGLAFLSRNPRLPSPTIMLT